MLALRHAKLALTNNMSIIADMEMLVRANSKAMAAVSELRKEVKDSPKSYAEVARSIRTDRHTVSKNLHRSDIALDKFFAISMSIGKDPEEIIRIAMLAKAEETTALAEGGE